MRLATRRLDTQWGKRLLKRAVRLALISVTACDADECDGPSASNEPNLPPNTNCVSSIVISPKTLTIEPGQTATFISSISDVCTGLTAAWSSSDQSAVLPLAAPGDVRGVVPGGDVYVIVSKGGKADSATVTVRQPIAFTVLVTPSPVTLNTGGPPIQLAASAINAFQYVFTLPSMIWTTSNAGVATVTNSGLVSSVGVGNALITATDPATQKNGSASIQVTNLCTILSDDLTLGNPFVATIFSQTSGTSQTIVQASPGGNPGAYALMTMTLPSPSELTVDYMFPTAYNPALVGAVAFVDYREDRIVISPPFAGAAFSGGIVLRQGNVRAAFALPSFSSTVWERGERLNLLPSNFPGVNFSVTGAPIQFGFYRSSSRIAGGTQLTFSHGADNWEVKVCR